MVKMMKRRQHDTILEDEVKEVALGLENWFGSTQKKLVMKESCQVRPESQRSKSNRLEHTSQGSVSSLEG